MKLRFYRIVATVADSLRDAFDRLHGWAVRRQTALNLRQLSLDFRARKGGDR